MKGSLGELVMGRDNWNEERQEKLTASADKVYSKIISSQDFASMDEALRKSPAMRELMSETRFDKDRFTREPIPMRHTIVDLIDSRIERLYDENKRLQDRMMALENQIADILLAQNIRKGGYE